LGRHDLAVIRTLGLKMKGEAVFETVERLVGGVLRWAGSTKWIHVKVNSRVCGVGKGLCETSEWLL